MGEGETGSSDKTGGLAAKWSALKASGISYEEALRASELETAQSKSDEDFPAQAESLVFQAELTLYMCKEANKPAPMSLLQRAKKNAELMKQHRPNDHLWLGEASYVLAEVELHVKAYKKALEHAKEAAVCFRKADKNDKRCLSIFMGAKAEALSNNFKSALALHEKAMEVLKAESPIDKASGDYGNEVLKEIESLTTAQKEEKDERERRHAPATGAAKKEVAVTEEELRRKCEEEVRKNMKKPAADTASSNNDAVATAKQEKAIKDAANERRDKMVSQIRATIQKVVLEATGSKIAVDAALLQSGFSSNMTVWLQEEISRQLPGTNLPVTLVYDYPTIADMADYIVDERMTC